MGTVGTHAINQALYKKMPFDPVKDFAPLTRVATVPNLLVAHPSQPFKTVKEVIAYAKAHPGDVTYGSPGSGSSPHVSGALFQSLTGAQITHVPYKGSAPAMSDLLEREHDLLAQLPEADRTALADSLRLLVGTRPESLDALRDESVPLPRPEG